MISAIQIASACQCSLPRAENWAGVLNEAMGIFAIDTPERVAAFLAQIAHESGRLAHVRELWGPTPAQLRYEGRLDLGNTEKGDGFRYRGRGLIQTTGRANYRATSKGLAEFVSKCPDFEASPELLEAPRWAALSAAWFWHSRSLNALADAGDFMRLTRRINGGTNGYADRLSLWDAAKGALSESTRTA